VAVHVLVLGVTPMNQVGDTIQSDIQTPLVVTSSVVVSTSLAVCSCFMGI
jgi:hypothetical protein